MGLLSNSRFNPSTGALDFWQEFRKPNPYRWPILAASMVPFGIIMWWLAGETVYKAPERPEITYISTFDPDRTDEEIMESNLANQEVKDLRKAAEEDLATRKRELYKALGAAAGMDVEEIERRGEEARAAEEAAEQARLDELLGRTDGATETAAAGAATNAGGGEESPGQ